MDFAESYMLKYLTMVLVLSTKLLQVLNWYWIKARILSNSSSDKFTYLLENFSRYKLL